MATSLTISRRRIVAIDGDETTAARTLRRDTASSGLDAVRRAARQSKRVRNVTLTQRRSLWVGNLWERANCEKRTLAIAA
jgi:hypothetical protein